MKLSLLRASAIGLAILPQYISASVIHSVGKRDEKPGFPVKSDTITTCTNWYDNWLGEECKVVRDWYFAISPEDFHRWNPSISLDCGGWEKWYSYCVGVQGPSSTSSSTSAPATTTRTSTAAPSPTPILKSWEPMGCFIDDFTLATKSTREGGATLTVDKCQAACWLDGFRFAGLQSGTECWCGTSVGGDWAKDQADCKTPCPGNGAQQCGGDKLLSVFRAVLDETPLPPGGQPPSITITTSTAATTTATAAPSAATWVPQGCYKDLAPTTVRPLTDRLINNAASLTIATCHTACRNAGFTLAGVENGNQCFCGHDIQEPTLNTPALESDCNKPCTGNSAQTCGGAGRMFVYRYAVPKQQAWQPLGCYKDLAPTTPRPLSDRLINNAGSLTVQTCQTACRNSSGKTLAGVENGNQCFCGHEIQEPATNVWVSSTECTKPCTGNSSESCGAAARMYIYKYATPERQVWRSLGCYKDLYPNASRTLDALLGSGTMTIERCHALCQDSVYKYAGLENGSQCWCGNDIRDPSTNVLTVMSECGTACTGNSDQTCGRSARMHIYEHVSA